MYVKNPNLPESDVSLVCVSPQKLEIIETLENLNIKVIKTYPHEQLQKPVQYHADMLMHHLCFDEIILAENNTILSASLLLEGFKIFKSQSNLQSQYPNDVLLNCTRMNDVLICNTKYTDELILKRVQLDNGIVLNVKQGYAKCSTCIVDSNSIISSDISICKAAKSNNINVLYIEAGDVDIDEYQYGFIGGCTGKLSKNILAFTGDISLHKNYKEIKAFLKQCNVEPYCLTNKKLFDIGGIIPLKIR